MTPQHSMDPPLQRGRRRLVQAVAASLGLSSLGWAHGLVWAQTAWPSRPVRLLVGFPPGSSPDLMARTIAEPLAQALGQPVVVENRPGAGGNVAADAVARADDGHTLGLLINGNMTIAKILNPATPYDPLTDLAPVSLLATSPLVLTAGAQVPGDAAAILAAGRAAGARWNYGSPGVGTVAHIGMEMFKGAAGWQAVHVPYPGNPQVINAMMQGDVQVALLPPGLAMPQVQAGKLKAVGLTSAGRSALVPQVASLAELGLSGFQMEIWNAVAAPARMNPKHIQRVSAALAEIVRRPEIRDKIFALGWQVAGTSAEGLANRVRVDTARMRDVIERHNIRPQ
ncbi:Bug family tripartite tricarboxylate transporter substrate binding protein [Tepidicella baoligensis]|uniref:Bug family tripartite tricarboxylate transporter substrate binding protein n=1 Tax=Tepidicella baoligensis TaxID=2707016 RepID=UPI001FE4C8D3|nr:tripartite tricarboxylate transporter substrate-binding protein [Tepidicella baoligensis]